MSDDLKKLINDSMVELGHRHYGTDARIELIITRLARMELKLDYLMRKEPPLSLEGLDLSDLEHVKKPAPFASAVGGYGTDDRDDLIRPVSDN